MCAAKNNADGVAKLLIEAKANLDVEIYVRPRGMHVHMRVGCLPQGQARPLGRTPHACAQLHSYPPHAHLTHLHHRDCRCRRV